MTRKYKSKSLIATSVVIFSVCSLTDTMEVANDQIDKIIEQQITQKIGETLLQSIERKFQTDLERSVDLVLVQIKTLLQNGTVQIQDRLSELQELLGGMKRSNDLQVERCLSKKQNATSALAEKALHQMVVCGYALIGHDPSQPVRNVIALKDMIKNDMKAIYDQKKEFYSSLKTCGHNHESLKKVIKCVISKSPLIKTTMMEVTGKLIEGVADLRKLMAHGAMHQACLIEVINSVEDEAFDLLVDIRHCINQNETMPEENKYQLKNNSTILEENNKIKQDYRPKIKENIKEVKEMKDIIRRMLTDRGQDLDKKFKRKLIKLQNDLISVDTTQLVSKTIKNN